MTNGMKVILSYYVIFYVIPAIGYTFYDDAIVEAFPGYSYTNPTILSSLYILLSFALYICMRKYSLKKKIHNYNICILPYLGNLYSFFRPYFASFCLLIALYGYRNHLLTFRYSSESISDSGISMILSLMQYLVMADVFYFTFSKRSKSISLINIIMSISLVLLSSGIVSSITGFSIFILTIFPQYKDLFISKIRFKPRYIFIFFIALFIAPQAFNLATNFGASIKHGTYNFTLSSAVDASSYQVNSTTSSLDGFVGRISSHYISLLATSQNLFNVEYSSAYVWSILIKGINYRLGRILRYNSYSDKPRNSTLSQYNYRNITQGITTNRTGSTPGVIASFNYFFLFPLNILILTIYLVFIERFINTLTYLYPEMNFFVTFFLSRTFFNFTLASPFDLINIIDGGFIYALIIFMMYRHNLNQIRSASVTKNTICNEISYT